jgi:bifunctional polynucleotide phosphatase/kinase
MKAGESSAGYSVIASAKRISTSQEVDSNKRAKGLFPLFTRNAQKDVMNGSTSSAFKWHTSLGTHKTCLKATFHEPFAQQIEERKKGTFKSKAKIACFDLDGCLIKPKNGKSFPSNTDEYDFEEAFRGTFDRVKKEYESGSCIIIVSNQKQTHLSNEPSKKLKTWKAKLEIIAQAINCPMMILAALSDDGFRKPGRLMWDHAIVPAYIEAGGKEDDIRIEGNVDEQASFFVGDAAGRIADHSDTDRKWAMNVGIPFYTPEEYFKGEKPRAYKLKGYRPTLEIANGESEPLPSDFFPATPTKLDLVVFVGPPGAGKTTLFKTQFASRGYQWVNQVSKDVGYILSPSADTDLS